MKLVEKIFSLRDEKPRRVLCILGVKLKFRPFKTSIGHIRDVVEYCRVPGFSEVSSVYEQMESVVRIAFEHQKSFGDCRFQNFGRDIVLCATGPSFDSYIPIKNAVHIGLNNAYKAKNIKFDSLFCHDPRGCFGGEVPLDFLAYGGDKCTKFVGNDVPFSLQANPKGSNIKFFHSANAWNFRVDYLPLPDFTSIAFAAMGYAFWTTPRRIFIVGADCSGGHAKCTYAKHSPRVEHLVKHWAALKEFAKEYYPDIEIISLNPVGLKGMFRDIYTKDGVYVDENGVVLDLGV